MPPKSKVVAKAAEKMVDDKTFGLKNKKKSKKVQAFVQQVQKNVDARAQAILAPKTEAEKKKEAQKKMKAAQDAAEKELQALLRASVKQPKLEAGVDPKSVLCEFFKAGVCEKGEKCKFSHDLAIARKSAKMSIYEDTRDDKKDDQIADWDQSKLEKVVNSKHGAEAKGNKTDIVCMYFLDALEKELYGWFWECPNGPTCKYRHALPPGYVFKTKKEREAEAALKLGATDDTSNLEELIEEERRKLPTTGLTPVTAESFARWKEEKAKRKAAETEAKRVEEAKKSGSKGYSALSGRALFSYDPALFVDDAGADDEVYSDDEEGEGGAAGGAGLDSMGELGQAIGDAGVFLEGEDDLDDIADEDEDEEDGEDGEEGDGGEEEDGGGDGKEGGER